MVTKMDIELDESWESLSRVYMKELQKDLELGRELEIVLDQWKDQLSDLLRVLLMEQLFE